MVLMLGLLQGVKAQTATDATPGQSKPSWFQRLWPFHKKKTPQPVPAQKSQVETVAARQAKEKADYLRRIAVCDKLLDIAMQSNDEELRRKADQLDQRAKAIYLSHTGQGTSVAGLPTDERILDRRLGQAAPTSQGLLPAQRASGSQASLREE
jgi:hypothetical protein